MVDRRDDYIRPRGYYDNKGNLLNVGFDVINGIPAQFADLAKYAIFSKTSNQSIPDTANTEVVWEAKTSYNSEDFCGIESGTGKIKVLQKGIYDICVRFRYNGNVTGVRYLNLNSISVLSIPSVGTVSTYISASAFLELAANETVSIIATQTSGGDLDLLSSGTIARIRRVTKL
ncbi:MAG: hypothetical protein WC428_06905 [Candidatus Paceibacterota bacterium]